MEKMTVESTRAVMERYWLGAHADTGIMAPDVVFRMMATGEEFHTPQGVMDMLQAFYHGAFEATVETRSVIIDAGSAVFEGAVVGQHTGEFAGVPATGRDVRIPIAVVYDVRDERIVEGRVYLEVPVFLAQVSG